MHGIMNAGEIVGTWCVEDDILILTINSKTITLEIAQVQLHKIGEIVKNEENSLELERGNVTVKVLFFK